MVNCQNYAIRHPAIVTRNSHDNADFPNHKDKARRDTAVKELAFVHTWLSIKVLGWIKVESDSDGKGNSGLKNN